jgi:hypothetical protein
MSQSASLYRITKTNFEEIIENPHDFKILSIAKAYITFEQTFEGIKFILSKGQNDATVSLVEQIFYPANCIGQETDYADLEDLPDNFDFESEPIYYNDADGVAELSVFLDGISAEQFNELFDADELNKNNVYPSKAWHNNTDPNRSFNADSLTKQFVLLKEFMSSAKDEQDYVLCFVG